MPLLEPVLETAAASRGFTWAPGMALGEEERYEIETVFRVLDQASSDFERLVDAKDRFEVLVELERFTQRDVRRIVSLASCSSNSAEPSARAPSPPNRPRTAASAQSRSRPRAEVESRPAGTEAERLRELDLDEVAEQAINTYTGSPARRAEIELERRLIAQSTRSSRRLEIATWVIAVLTAALIGIAVLQLVGVLD